MELINFLAFIPGATKQPNGVLVVYPNLAGVLWRMSKIRVMEKFGSKLINFSDLQFNYFPETNGHLAKLSVLNRLDCTEG